VDLWTNLDGLQVSIVSDCFNIEGISVLLDFKVDNSIFEGEEKTVPSESF